MRWRSRQPTSSRPYERSNSGSIVTSMAGASLAVHCEAAGLLLYPTTERELDETMFIQGHSIRVATVNLDQPWNEIERRLLYLARRELDPAPARVDTTIPRTCASANRHTKN